jgi:hypothetical protein
MITNPLFCLWHCDNCRNPQQDRLLQSCREIIFFITLRHSNAEWAGQNRCISSEYFKRRCRRSKHFNARSHQEQRQGGGQSSPPLRVLINVTSMPINMIYKKYICIYGKYYERERIMFITHLKPLQPKTKYYDNNNLNYMHTFDAKYT